VTVLVPLPVLPPLERLERLRACIRDLGSALVCYSGGVDSALVLAVAHEVLGARAIGMTAVSPSLAPFEKEAAVAIAGQIGARHELVESHEIERPGYVANAPDRCFHCKSELYDIAAEKQRQWNVAHVLNGTNLDDLGDHRPSPDQAEDRPAESGPPAEHRRRAAKHLGRRGHVAELGEHGLHSRERIETRLIALTQALQGGCVLGGERGGDASGVVESRRER